MLEARGANTDKVAPGHLNPGTLRMTLEDASLISQIIAGIAVVASLIFVGLQLRQNDKTQRAAMHQARADRIIGIFHHLAEPHMAAAMAKADQAPETMSAEELIQLRSFITVNVLSLEDQLRQQKAGLLDPAAVRRTRHFGKIIFSSPAVRAAWQLLRQGMDPQQVETVEKELIANQPVRSSVDSHALWLKTLADIKANAAAS